MKKVISFLKSRVVISLFGMLIFSLLIWFLGPSFKFGENNFAPLASTVSRLIGIIVILLVWGVNNLIMQMRNKEKNDLFSNDVVINPEAEEENSNSKQVTEEHLKIKQGFSQAISIIKNDKFKGFGKHKTKYGLPWYLIIGLPGSGKTTALANSGLEFPLADQLDTESQINVGSTPNCAWWFANEAVFIDTAGRYTSQQSQNNIDNSAWKEILGLLQKSRRRRPINGVIITISLQEILKQTEEERVSHAKVIRSRIDELMSKFQTRFPVYLVFTKTDFVSGFTEFFEDLRKEEREQVWGVSLPESPDPSKSPDFSLVGSELQNMLVRIHDRVLWRINQERDSMRRGLIYGFPVKMENAIAIAETIIKQTFSPNAYQMQPYLRGVYFTSGKQEDAFTGGTKSQQKLSSGNGFFLTDLFRKVIFPESELVGSSKKHETLMTWSQRITYAVITVLAIGILFSWTASVSRHEKYKTQVETYLSEFNNEAKYYDGQGLGLEKMLPGLNALGKASMVYDQNNHPWLSGMGLYNNDIDEAADAVYQDNLKAIFLPKLINELETSLTRSNSTGDLYSTFVVYLMFNKAEYMNKNVIRNWFESYWSSQTQLEGRQQDELEAHLIALLDLNLDAVNLDVDLISQIRGILQQTPISNRVYSRIRTNVDYSMPINMLNVFGESVRETFKVNLATNKALLIPTLFTIDGYKNIDLSSESIVIKNIVNERWVMSDDDEDDSVELIDNDIDEISEKVKALYYADYVASWNELFLSLEVTEFKHLQHASSILSKFSDPVYSPLLSILAVAKANTQLSSPILANLAADHDTGNAGKVTSGLANRFEGNKVDKQFRSLNSLLRESSKGPAPVDVLIEEINKLETFVEQISASPEPSKKAFEIVKARYENGAANPITSLRALAKNTPQPVQRWLYSIADETWNVMLRSAHAHVSSELLNQVYLPYKTGLAGRYPLNRSAKQELEMLDFSEFFKPQGTIDKFFIEYIKPFVNTRQRWSNREVDGNSLGISSKTLAQLKKANKVKSMYFKNNAEVPGLDFQMRPFSMTKHDARFTLEVGDKSMSYSHGPKFWKSLRWSGDDDNNRARIIFEDLNGEFYSRTYNGSWAWFRLQDDFKLRKVGRSNVYRVTYVVNQLKGESLLGHKIEFEIKAQSANHSLGDNSLATFRCPKNI